MRRFWGILAATAALALIGAPSPSPALAGIVGVAPADSDGPNADFRTNDALWAVGVSNVFDGVGQVCAAEASAAVSSSCETDAFWGQPNAIGIVGTFLQPIVAPYLPMGTYKLIGDNGGDGSTNVESPPFTVSACDPGNCTTDIAQADLDQWKAAAGAALDGPAAACLASTAYNVNGDKTGGATSFAAAGGSVREYLLSIVQSGQPELKFRKPQDSLDEAISLLQKVSCGAYLMYGDIIADPPDPDFRHPVEPAPSTPDLTGLVHADGAIAQIEQLRAEGVAQRRDIERYQGAKVAGDAGWAAFHAARAGVAGLRMQQGMKRAVADLRAYATELDAEPDLGAASAADLLKVRQIRDRIRTSGLLPSEVADLQGLGLTSAQIAEVEGQLKAPLPPGTSVPTPADGLRAEANALEHASCGEAPRRCDFDAFARKASAVGGDTALTPALQLGDQQLTEGDRGVNHLAVVLRLSHPSESPAYGRLDVADPVAHPDVTADEQFYFAPGQTTTTVRLLVRGDTVPEPDAHVVLNVDPQFGIGPHGPITLTVHDDDGGAKARSGAHGLLAFTGPGEPSTYVAEPDGTNVTRVFDDTDLHRLVVTDWSRDGGLMLMHRVPRTLDDGQVLGAGYYALRATPADLGQPGPAHAARDLERRRPAGP